MGGSEAGADRMRIDEPPRILCVDDEKNVLRALQRIFLDEDYELLLAGSGEEGLESLRENDPVQVVISDYRMPGMNGVDFLKEVRAGWPDTIRIVLSGFADSSTIVDAINEGQIYKFVPKPWNDDELKVTIAKAVELYQLRQKNRQLARELAQANEELRQLNGNLEKMVKERTEEVLFRNQALAASQNILHALPLAVLGLDPDHHIVQCNKRGMALFAGKGDILGRRSDEVLPAELLAFIGEIPQNGENTAELTINGVPAVVRGNRFRGAGGQSGLVVVIY